MDAVTEVEAGGRRFQLYPPKGRAAIELDRRVMSLLAEAVGPGGGDVESVGKAVSVTMGRIPEDEFTRLVGLTLGGAVMLGGDGGRDERLSGDSVWGAFAGRVDELYGLMFRAWEVYGLTPFARLRSGSSTAPTP